MAERAAAGRGRREEEGGFKPITLDRGYGSGSRVMSYLYKGVAVVAG